MDFSLLRGAGRNKVHSRERSRDARARLVRMLEEFGPRLYVADGPSVSFYGFPYPTRMAAAKLADNTVGLVTGCAIQRIGQRRGRYRTRPPHRFPEQNPPSRPSIHRARRGAM
jgi:hypothetical protein